MASYDTLLLYRQILKAAKTYPSIKRARIISNIKSDFHKNKHVEDENEIQKLKNIALNGIAQLSMYNSLNSAEKTWNVNFAKEPVKS
jgi:hypothetical protein